MKRKLLRAFLAGGAVLGALGVWILLTPDNPLTALFRGPISDTNGKVIIGPYPVESDFQILKTHRVKTIASLLDPRVPYEAILLEREKRLAEKAGLTVVNFPMTSVLGRALGADAEERARAAADGVAALDGKVYMHCYLGIHRVKRVKDLLDAHGTTSGTYLIRQGARSQDARLLDRAQQEFDRAEYTQVLEAISGMASPDPPALLLRGWSHYYLGNMDDALAAFKSALGVVGNIVDGLLGAGYASLRLNDVPSADSYFSKAAAAEPDNVSALVGLAHVRFRQGNLAEAADLSKRALSIEPANMEARDILARSRPGKN